MAGDIAQAFVRIRPNTSGFAAETEAGVKGAFSTIGKHLTEALGVAFGLKTGFDFTKGIVEGAADLQKQVEAIKNEFGSAGDAILAFSNKGATNLGISADAADQAAAKFGLLFRGIGIGQKDAAEMTLGFEKLAGSIATIRNVPAGDILAAIPAAIAGSTRGLKTLGIAVDSNTIKLAALKLGLIQVGGTLTTADRAIAIYSLATGRLPQIQAQAAAHSGDLADQTAKLAAEWSNAKDELGKELLPQMTRLATYLADHLPGAIHTVITDMHKFAAILHDVLGPIGGVKGAIGTLIGAFAVGKVLEFAKAIRVNLIQNGIRLYGEEALKARTAYVGAMGTMELATIGLGATIRGALISTGIGALVVAAGFAAQYIITHWTHVKEVISQIASGWVRVFSAAWAAIRETGKATAYYLLESFTGAIQGTLSLASHLPFVGKYAKEGLDSIQGAINKFKPDWGSISDAFGAGGQQAGTAFGAQFSAAAQAAIDIWGQSGASTKSILGGLSDAGFNSDLLTGNLITSSGDVISPAVAKARKDVADLQTQLSGLTAQQAAAVRSAQTAITNLQQGLADAITQESRDVADAVNQAKSNLASIMGTLSSEIGNIIDAPLNALQAKLDLQSNKLTLENLRRSVLLPGGKQLSTDPEKALAQLKKIASESGTTSRAAVQSFYVQYQQAVLGVQQAQAGIKKQKIDIQLGDLGVALNRGKITAAQFAKGLREQLKKDGVNMKTTGTLLGQAFVQGLNGTLAGALLQAQAIRSGPQSNAPYNVPGITYPLRVLQADQKDIAQRARDLATKQNSLTAKIAGYNKKSVALLQQIHDIELNTSLARNPGVGGRRTKDLTGVSK